MGGSCRLRAQRHERSQVDVVFGSTKGAVAGPLRCSTKREEKMTEDYTSPAHGATPCHLAMGPRPCPLCHRLMRDRQALAVVSGAEVHADCVCTHAVVHAACAQRRALHILWASASLRVPPRVAADLRCFGRYKQLPAARLLRIFRCRGYRAFQRSLCTALKAKRLGPSEVVRIPRRRTSRRCGARGVRESHAGPRSPGGDEDCSDQRGACARRT